MSISIGPVALHNPVLLAPMSGVTDEAFRTIAHATGAGAVVSEMVASEELARSRPDMVRRTRGKSRITPFIIQLAGREARWMAEGARIAEGLGAQVIDINMGCPARQVTGGLSGSALMRDPDNALSLIEATVQATKVPVTVKMRLGWDERSLNAPHIARRAQEAGVQMVTVHGRTRCQFYKGRADWSAIRAVKDALSIPLVANGDGETAHDVRTMQAASGADGVMLGRACYGRPWWPGRVAAALAAGTDASHPTLAEERDLVLWHHEETLLLYGARLGNKMFRKHLGWVIERLADRGLLTAETARAARAQWVPQPDNAQVTAGIHAIYVTAMDAGKVAA